MSFKFRRTTFPETANLILMHEELKLPRALKIVYSPHQTAETSFWAFLKREMLSKSFIFSAPSRTFSVMLIKDFFLVEDFKTRRKHFALRFSWNSVEHHVPLKPSNISKRACCRRVPRFTCVSRTFLPSNMYSDFGKSFREMLVRVPRIVFDCFHSQWNKLGSSRRTNFSSQMTQLFQLHVLSLAQIDKIYPRRNQEVVCAKGKWKH